MEDLLGGGLVADHHEVAREVTGVDDVEEDTHSSSCLSATK